MQGRRLGRTASEDGPANSPRRIDAFVDSRAVLVAEIAILAVLAASLATKVWQEQMWIGFVLVAAATVVWLPELLRQRDRRWWFLYVVGIYVYTLARAYADDTGIATKVDYVVAIERAFGGNPGVWLQAQLFDRRHLDVIDYVAVGLHWSFFFAPHALAAAVSLFQRHLFGFYTTLIVGTMYVGLIGFYLLPTAPPWFAGSIGTIDAYRVMDFVGGTVNANAYESLYAAVGEPNSFAAMPSAHMAVTFGMFLYSFTFAKRFRWPLLAYSALMGLALVYMAEHYVVDLIAGLACTLVAFSLALPLGRRRHERPISHEGIEPSLTSR